MNVLVIGGCGYVGSALINLLKYRSDCNVTILDNMLVGENPNSDVECIKADIRSASETLVVNRYDIVVHLAGVVGAPSCSIDEQFAFDVNVTGTQNVVQALNDGARIIFASSTSAYGNKINEVVTEETSLAPLTNYGLHKLYGETIIRRSDNPYIIVRPATAFGLSQRSRLDVLPNTLIYDALTKPKIDIYEPHVIRPFIHVLDFARVLEHAILGHMPMGIYNIGDPAMTMQKGQLASQIVQLTNTEVNMVSGADPDKRNYDVSFAKLMATGFTPMMNALPLAVNQIRDKLDTIKAHYDEYNAPFHVKEYIRKYGNEYKLY